ncbi:2-hydroxycarboxylate transporter family protein [Chromobacterium violaceum]|uniref:2-hydroxycarboxylate transporter family protein n=1 Tax=Chromobacterium violaceum TaxID=536 RepID=UPI001B32FDA8|nr:2-hydroxycarboxylate transporter family protein [Chromobacterium violaceum]MBP4045734.1 2-hydroxycarboxylate transporter family protein [Chromobacterium violaceum]
MHIEETVSKPPAGNGPWSKLMAMRIGPLPLPLYLSLAAIVVAAAIAHRLPNDLIGGLAVMMLSGFLLGELGKRIPVLKHIGGSAILCLFIPSALLGYKLFDPDMLKALTTAMKTANLQYLYIACLVVGSILGMNHKVLVQGFLRMFIPLLVGTLGAVVAGMLVGLLFGYTPGHTFFYIIIPILGGGIGEGILPLSIGYSEMTRIPQAQIVATLIPAALIGNVVAILLAGLLNFYGKKRPRFSGNGMLVKTGEDREWLAAQHEAPINLGLMGSGLLLTCAFFTLGSLFAPITGIPGPILMIITAALVKVSKVMPAQMELGAYQMYKFMTSNLTYAILVGLGTLFVPWNQMVASVTPGYVLLCAVIVLAMVASGFGIGLLLKMYPVESAIVAACHSGLGGTGDVAILSAANRMEMMPFAQISTRIGGASMIVLATLLMKLLH